MQKTDWELKHAIERYEEICLRIIASTVCHLKCIIMTSDCIHQFRCFWNKSAYIFWLNASILDRSLALHFYWKYHSFHGFILFLASLFIAQSPKYRDFKVPKPFLQFRNVLLRYRHIKCIYTNYIWHRRYQGHQTDDLCSALLPFLVHGSGVAPILVSLCIFLLHASILNRFFALQFYWKYH